MRTKKNLGQTVRFCAARNASHRYPGAAERPCGDAILPYRIGNCAPGKRESGYRCNRSRTTASGGACFQAFFGFRMRHETSATAVAKAAIPAKEVCSP